MSQRCFRQYAIDYAGLYQRAPSSAVQSLTGFLREHLPIKWRKAYASTTAHVTNIVRLQRGTFEYFYDSYSGLEEVGEIPFDQRIRDRVIGVLGTSAPRRSPRRGSLVNGCLDLPEELEGTDRDKGHFMAHSIGGGLDVNVFSQDRNLNRGVSHAGRVYRQMERYCHAHPGTFCFSRPVYTDTTSVPRWLEFGLIREDGSLWGEVFDN